MSEGHEKTVTNTTLVDFSSSADQLGRALKESLFVNWNHDPWRLDYEGNGTKLADGASFLLPYYLGLYHGFLVE